ncbi:MAG TPA: hypothetical protein VG983_07475 [Caulobacterales bacterium]|nr:hypothetical protein [Caulobacterales bacterium]
MGALIVFLGAKAALMWGPPPAGVNPTHPADMHAWYERAGLAAIWPFAAIWIVAACAGAFAAARVGAATAGRAAAVLLTIGAALNLAFIPVAMWMWAIVILVAACSWFAGAAPKRA